MDKIIINKINIIASNLLDKTENKFKETGYYDKLMNARNSREWEKIIKKIDRDLSLFSVSEIIEKIARRKMNYIRQRKHLRDVISDYGFKNFILGVMTSNDPEVKYDQDDLFDDTVNVYRVVDMFGDEYLAEFRASGRENGIAWN